MKASVDVLRCLLSVAPGELVGIAGTSGTGRVPCSICWAGWMCQQWAGECHGAVIGRYEGARESALKISI